jgi:hypothetical protein
MTGKDLILGLLIFLVLMGIIWVKKVRPEDVNSLAEFQNGKVWVYEVKGSNGTDCYVVVGHLHGRTVAIDCVGGTYTLDPSLLNLTREAECGDNFSSR